MTSTRWKPARVRLLVALIAVCVPLAMSTPATAAPGTPPSGPAVAEPGASGSTPPDARGLGVEEQRLAKAAPQEILRRSGFDAAVGEFTQALNGVREYGDAARLGERSGERLWRRAVDRAQGRGPAGGDLSRDDDRPLYWARLAMTKSLREWAPSFDLPESRRSALIARLERSSRGQTSIGLPAGRHVRRIVVTGFDPFRLDADIRRSNPSGAAALALDGTTILTASGPARIETAVFPVRWADFAQGTVERTLLPYFRSGPRQVDLFTTVSQGRIGRFDVERFNGAWRGGSTDNANLSRTETVPIPAGVPTIHPQPQWTLTSLPYGKIVAAGTGPFPVYDNTSVTEIPAGATEPVDRADGPTRGSAARAGGGGDYLSNEIAYRATLLRDALRLRMPGGHLHTPVLEFGPGNTDPTTGVITDPDFVRNRLAITEQVREVLRVAAGTLG
ncbi:pyroglutamyl peptidase [Streptomyces pathocidini]|uniref:pyroglutamyl peptidase n=1 Tax=Streptomyces pathocidini TaxID=1650571 RepID=UPI0033CD0255